MKLGILPYSLILIKRSREYEDELFKRAGYGTTNFDDMEAHDYLADHFAPKGC